MFISLVSRSLDLNSDNANLQPLLHVRVEVWWTMNELIEVWFFSWLSIGYRIVWSPFTAWWSPACIACRLNLGIVVHLRTIAVVVELETFNVILVLMNLPFAVKAVGRVAIVGLGKMFHQVMHGSCGELGLTRVAKVHNFLSIQVSSEPRGNCVRLRDVIWNVILCPRPICLMRSIVVYVVVIVVGHVSWDSIVDC